MSLRRDAERVEEEIAGVERPPRPRGLASDYLRQAAESLHAAGDPGHLYRQWQGKMPPEPLGWEFMRQWAREERFRQSRTCALFCALAAEAYVNEFLAASDLSKTRLRRIDRWPTVRKYVDGTAEAFGGRLFEAGDEATPTLEELFALRHELVHPKPGLGSPGLLAPDDPDLAAKFAMVKLAEYVVIVGGSADMLTRRAYGYDTVDVPGTTLWQARSAVREFAVRRAPLPAPDEPPEPSIWQLLGQYLDALPRIGDHPEASWTRLKEARRRKRRSAD